MKKLITMLCATALILTSTIVSAATGKITVEPEIDFDNSIIKVSCTTDAKYNQALSIVMYSGTAMGNDINKFIQIIDTNADTNGKAYVEFKLSSDVPSGDYIISVTGGGRLKGSDSKVITYISPSGLQSIVDQVNSANITNVKTILEQYRKIFTLPTDDGVYEQFLSVRKADYADHYKEVMEIVDSLKYAQHNYDLNKATTAAEILSYFKDNAEGLDIDVTSDDFELAGENVSKSFLKLKTDNALTGNKSFVDTFQQAMAIGLVNSCNTKNMTAAITKYADVIGIPVEEYKSNCSKYSAVEINKIFHDKNFTSCAQIKEAYEKRVKEILDAKNKENKNTGGGSSGGGGSSSTGKSKSAIESSLQDFLYVNPLQEEATFTDFTDLDQAAWAKESIKKLAKDGVVSGYEDNSFKPNNIVTREEFITILVRAFKQYKAEAECEFTDISKDDWCYTYVASAAEKKYVSGFEDGSFGKGSLISRQDAATILHRAGTDNGLYFAEEEFEFSDGEEIAEYAKSAILGLRSSGVINGFEDGSFKPADSLTRAQAVKMIEVMLGLKK